VKSVSQLRQQSKMLMVDSNEVSSVAFVTHMFAREEGINSKSRQQLHCY
jgi:hypothetical protein